MTDQSEINLQNSNSHRRRNALTGDWVLVSPQRLNRPWQGAQSNPTADTESVKHDPRCYLCAGNVRMGGQTNPDYAGVYVFDNDFPAIQDLQPNDSPDSHPLFSWAQTEGVCRVISFSPDHGRTLSALSIAEVTAVIEEWANQSAELGARFPDGSVQIFENKGEMMGCSQPHPHGQIWAQQSLPTILATELNMCRLYEEQHGSVLLSEYVDLEMQKKERVVDFNEHFVVLVPYWATWPFETLICPRRLVSRMPQLSSGERKSFADLIRGISIRYDNLFGVSFPYSAGVHQAPANGQWDDVFSLHMHFYPPLLRSASVKKFMVGYEMLAEPQRDISPEEAAKILRGLSEKSIHDL